MKKTDKVFNALSDHQKCEHLHYNNHNNLTERQKEWLDENTDFNVCNKCDSIQQWDTEMYWYGEECQRTNEILGGFDCVCDKCFDKLEKNYKGVHA